MMESDDKVIEKILNKINNIKSSTGKTYRFISFASGKYLGFYNTKLIIQDVDANEVREISYASFMKHNGWSSKLEKIRIPEEIAIERINEKLKSLNDIKFLGFDKGKWIGVIDSWVILEKTTTREIGKIKYRSFLNSGWVPDSERLNKLEIARKEITLSEEDAIANINQKLKTINREIEFIDFKDGWSGSINSTIILKNSKGEYHEMLYCDFIRSRNSIGWRFSDEGFHYISENLCMKLLRKILLSETIIRQYKIQGLFGKIIKVDFYIPSRSIFIEYDGSQHYRWEPYIHKTYSKFVDQVNRDNYLIKYCQEHSIKLLRIPYCDRNRIGDILKAFLTEGRDISTHIEPKLLPVPMSYYG